MKTKYCYVIAFEDGYLLDRHGKTRLFASQIDADVIYDVVNDLSEICILAKRYYYPGQIESPHMETIIKKQVNLEHA